MKIPDPNAPLSELIIPIGAAPAPMELWFTTRGSKGTFAEFDIRQTEAGQFGAVREIAQYDNLLFVAALDGGVLAYDVSDPQALIDKPDGPSSEADRHRAGPRQRIDECRHRILVGPRLPRCCRCHLRSNRGKSGCSV